MTLPFAGDLVVAVLLVFTIIYAAMLNRRLAGMRSDKAELQALIQGLTAASHNAETAVSALKSANDDIGRQLESKVGRAQSLRDDLSYMIERGTTLADRLEGAIRARRDTPAPEAPVLKPARRADSAADAPREPASLPSRRERDLLRALAGQR
jgi:septal ring factor EnvC (AmiA/AmiB activator)